MMRARQLAAACGAALALSGCSIAAVDYGKIRHAEYVADQRCDAQPGAVVDGAALPHFFVTSRLPDCRASEIELLHHRGDQMRYGRFDAPRDVVVAKKKRFLPPLAFQAAPDWWRALQAETDRKQGRVLLYVHGYRESFATTSKDAAQIARMTGFDGPIIEYSWPSQGKLFSYVVDETNMYHDVRNFRDFLKTLAEQGWVREIVIVSHSLGARLVIPAVAYVDRASSNADSSNISNIILASPDFDRETFERDIEEEVLSARRVANDRRITIYASRADRALAASRAIHGYPRLGSPYCFNPFEAAELKARGLPERCYPAPRAGLTVIDTTDVSRGSTGHSNILLSAPACRDFIDVVAGKRTRPERVATPWTHVFRLEPDPALTKAEHDAICRRTAEAGDDR
ncbi:alpha/beta hydrolase [Sphingopyxis alaskensis]|uniref:alpha/beta hydrolase n=1 Tax=Sphingopyxis alaskensis TaxID=117207 RepID=UPI0039190B32